MDYLERRTEYSRSDILNFIRLARLKEAILSVVIIVSLVYLVLTVAFKGHTVGGFQTTEWLYYTLVNLVKIALLIFVVATLVHLILPKDFYIFHELLKLSG